MCVCAGSAEALTLAANDEALAEAAKAREELKEKKHDTDGHRAKRSRSGAKIESQPTLILGETVPSEEEEDGTPAYEEGQGGPEKYQGVTAPVAKATAAKSRPDPVRRKIDFSDAAGDTEMTQRDEDVSPTPVAPEPEDTKPAEERIEKDPGDEKTNPDTKAAVVEERTEEPKLDDANRDTQPADEMTVNPDDFKPAEERTEEPKPDDEKTSDTKPAEEMTRIPNDVKPAEVRTKEPKPDDEKTDHDTKPAEERNKNPEEPKPADVRPVATPQIKGRKGDSTDSLADMLNRASTQDHLDATVPTPPPAVTPAVVAPAVPPIPPSVLTPAVVTSALIPAPGVASMPVAPIPPAVAPIPEPSQVLQSWKNKKRTEEQKKIHAKKMCFYRSLDSAKLRLCIQTNVFCVSGCMHACRLY